MKNRKKAILFLYPLVFTFVFVFGVYYLSDIFKPDIELQILFDYIGQNQLELLKVNPKIEKERININQIGKYATYRSILRLSFGAGYEDRFKSPCGSHQTYTIWKSAGQECYPTKQLVFTNFKTFLKKDTNLFFSKYTDEYKLNNHDFLVEGKLKVTGIASIPRRFNIFPPKYSIGSYEIARGLTGYYLVKPSFVAEVDYDLGIYDQMVELTKEIVRDCLNEDKKIVCVEAKAILFTSQNNRMEWEAKTAENNPNLFLFDVTHQFGLPFFDQPIVQFGILLPDVQAQPPIDLTGIS